MSNANDTQVGGEHYRSHGRTDLQHWDVVNIFNLDYFQGNISKYLFRWKTKNGVQDLEKAMHYLQKYTEIAGEKKAQELKNRIDDLCADIGGTVFRDKVEGSWKIGKLQVSYSPDDPIEYVAQCLAEVPSSDLLKVVQYRERQAEKDSMDAHAQALDGDGAYEGGFVCTEFKGTVLGLTCETCGKFLGDHLPPDSFSLFAQADELEHGAADNENPLQPAPIEQCAGCGLRHGVHTEDCPRVRDAALVHAANRTKPEGCVSAMSGPGAVPQSQLAGPGPGAGNPAPGP